METKERNGKLLEVLISARFLDDFVKLPPAILASQFDTVEERNEAFADATETVLAFVMEQIEAAAGDVIELAGDPLRKAKTALIQAQLAEHNPDPPPDRSTTPGRKGNLPKFVKREGVGFSCTVRRQGLNIYKGGFETARAAHEYAVGQIEKAGGDATLGTGTRGRTGVDGAMPRFVHFAYGRPGGYVVLCNQAKVRFNRRGFKTAAAASEWAEAEFARRETGLSRTPAAASGHANRGDPGRPRTRAEVKAAIEESKKRRLGPKRRWVECSGCGDELGIPGGPMPEVCPKCGSGGRATMEGRDGDDAEEVRS